MEPSPSTGEVKAADPEHSVRVRKAALFYVSAGSWVLPIYPGSKRPSAGMSWNDPESDRIARTAEDVERLWGDGGEYRGHGVGMFCSQESRTLVLDIDVKNAERDGRKAFMELNTRASLPNTLQNNSPSGGFHRIYRVPGNWKPLSDRSPRFAVDGMDILFNRRQAVMAPSLYAGGGGEYCLTYLDGKTVSGIAELTSDQVDWVLYGRKFIGSDVPTRAERVGDVLAGEWDTDKTRRDAAAGLLMQGLSVWPTNRYGEAIVNSACSDLESAGSGARYNTLKKQVMRVCRATVDENGTDGPAQINLEEALTALARAYAKAQGATGEWSTLEESNFDDTVCWALSRPEIVEAARQTLATWNWGRTRE